MKKTDFIRPVNGKICGGPTRVGTKSLHVFIYLSFCSVFQTQFFTVGKCDTRNQLLANKMVTNSKNATEELFEERQHIQFS